VTYGGKKYEQRFSRGFPHFVDQRGKVVAGSTAKALEEAVRPNKSPSTRASTTVDLTESLSLMRESAQLRYRALRKRQSGSTAISLNLLARRGAGNFAPWVGCLSAKQQLPRTGVGSGARPG
jgi:hypothetical protein